MTANQLIQVYLEAIAELCDPSTGEPRNLENSVTILIYRARIEELKEDSDYEPE